MHWALRIIPYFAHFYINQSSFQGDYNLTLYISTTNGRALYYFITLLKSSKLKYKIEVPGQSNDTKGTYLTTDKERPSYLDSITYEEMSKDEVLDKILIFEHIFRRRNIQVGIDPGSRIGIALAIENKPIHMCIENDVQGVIDLASKLSIAKLGNLDFKIGDGRPEMTQKIIDGLRPFIKANDFIQIVNEKRTTPKGRARVKKDMIAAFHIAMKSGKNM